MFVRYQNAFCMHKVLEHFPKFYFLNCQTFEKMENLIGILFLNRIRNNKITIKIIIKHFIFKAFNIQSILLFKDTVFANTPTCSLI